MDKQKLAALKGSIKKWEGIVDGVTTDKGADNCPLCGLFRRRVSLGYPGGCFGCPVSAETRMTACEGTPYQDWVKAHAEIGEPPLHRKVTDDETVMCAVLELEFLKSLLPK